MPGLNDRYATGSASEQGLVRVDAKRWPVLCSLGIFVACIVASWAWFNLSKTTLDLTSLGSSEAIWLSNKAEVSGYTYQAESLSRSVLDELWTTNVLNGLFQNLSNETSIRVYFASWKSSKVRKLASLFHTPDWCWSGAGWKFSDQGQPSQVQLQIRSQTLPFECRIFQSPDRKRLELVVWSALVRGKIVPEAANLTTQANLKQGFAERISDTAWRTFFLRVAKANARFSTDILIERAGVSRFGIAQQVVRLSTAVTGTWTDSLALLEAFLTEWIEICPGETPSSEVQNSQPGY